MSVTDTESRSAMCLGGVRALLEPGGRSRGRARLAWRGGVGALWVAAR
jgi:hypothetical protein